jgi:hypothetical protein
MQAVNFFQNNISKQKAIKVVQLIYRQGLRLHRVQVVRPNLGPQNGRYQRWLLISSYTSGNLRSNILKHTANSPLIFLQFVIYDAIHC